MKKIIVPVDFSELASHALNFAIEFNDKIKGEIVLIHVMDAPVGHASFGNPAMETFYEGEFIKGIHNKLEEWSLRVKELGQKVTTRLKFGNTFKSISEAVSEDKSSWIVMGSKGSSGLKEIFIGSNAERMIRYAKCPVLIVKGETHIKDMKSMAFVSDLSEEQDLVANYAKEVQELLGLNMHLVKVKTPYNWLDDVQVEKQLEHYAERNFLKDFTKSSIDADFADEGAVKFAEENNVGIIVLGTHGKKGLAHIIGGSIAEDVVNESKVPILVFKIPDM